MVLQSRVSSSVALFHQVAARRGSSISHTRHHPKVRQSSCCFQYRAAHNNNSSDAATSTSTTSKMSLLCLSETHVRQCLDMKTCINVNRKALIALATKDAIVPTRLSLPYRDPLEAAATAGEEGVAAADCTLFKPASLLQRQQRATSLQSTDVHSTNANITTTGDDIDKSNTHSTDKHVIAMGMKVVSLRTFNPSHRGLPLVPATIVHINPTTGQVDAILAATYLTGARTAAGSALAIQHYFYGSSATYDEGDNEETTATRTTNSAIQKNDRLQHVVIFGAGLQAEQHILAISEILHQQQQHSISEHDATLPLGPTHPRRRRIPRVTIINRNLSRAEQLRDNYSEYMEECHIISLSDTSSVENAISTANVIVTCTNSSTPLWTNNNIVVPTTNCIITGIGSYTPQMAEIPRTTVDQCHYIWIDTPDAVSVGDLHYLKSDGDGNSDAIVRPQLLGQVLLRDTNAANVDPRDDTHHQTNSRYDKLCLYKAVGTAIQDVMTADAVVDRAIALGLGTYVDMS